MRRRSPLQFNYTLDEHTFIRRAIHRHSHVFAIPKTCDTFAQLRSLSSTYAQDVSQDGVFLPTRRSGMTAYLNKIVTSSFQDLWRSLSPSFFAVDGDFAVMFVDVVFVLLSTGATDFALIKSRAVGPLILPLSSSRFRHRKTSNLEPLSFHVAPPVAI